MHTCTRADLQQKLSGEHIVLSEGKEMCGHSSWPIPSLKRLREKLMSLLQPHSSPDKTADYTTCSGRRIVHVFACTLYLCVRMCVSLDPKPSSVNRMFTSQEGTFSEKHAFTHQSTLTRCNLSLSHLLARLHTPIKQHP